MTVFHRLNIAAITRETPDAVAITLHVPEQLRSHYHYTPGQHLTLKALIDGQELRRCYSICSSPQDGVLQIGVKAIPEGRFSGFANTHLKSGDSIDVMVPQGQFGYLPRPGTRGNYLAVAAGSGITPLLSIITTTLQQEPESRFTLIYGNRTSRTVMFREALTDLKNRYAQRFQVLYLFSQENGDSPLLNGRIDSEHLVNIGRTLLDYSAFDRAFVCGPESMMDDVHTALEQAGMTADRIFSERFNTSAGGIAASATERVATRFVLVQDGAEQEIEMSTEDDSILDAALRQGADLPYACKGGVCATCKCRVLAGEVEMGINYSLEPDQIEAGFILSCQSRPKGDGVVLDFDV